jgi:hypothetical protein
MAKCSLFGARPQAMPSIGDYEIAQIFRSVQKSRLAVLQPIARLLYLVVFVALLAG